MLTHKKIKVLVVDDSPLFREVISRGIESDPMIQVIAKAGDPLEARDYILKYEPDVMICDIEMPKMNGLDFIRRLLPQYPMPVLVISSANYTEKDALNAGAVEFIPKPNTNSAENVKKFIIEMVQKVKIAARGAKAEETTILSPVIDQTKVTKSKIKLISIGASTGGTDALTKIISALPTSGMPGIVIVQHIPPVFSRMFAERLNQATGFTVKEAQTGDIVEPGKILIAPGEMHMKIKRAGSSYKVVCSQGERVNGHCPSVDVLFDSVAKEAGKDALGVILTGMGYDGAKGMLAMRRKGARTIGQDEASSVVYGMPMAAFNIGAVEKQASLTKIPQVIYSIVSGKS
ncbi:chemotaxis protein [Bacillus sp. FJAT-18017]|uniref:protein-glutamate methylesterase/protein-glutamine glutaminase n=1 Tax=Bacillus sp. FJAT-18017 TaxID=1705566 RepID=UPI0006AEB44B|nr:chemotaxis response regulator protein-glutamate methylesterase [Bacillus sp. FJAT-18017]ALC92964.1 chemotaxis protein [Bacillus sp. FJAT-18017]